MTGSLIPKQKSEVMGVVCKWEQVLPPLLKFCRSNRLQLAHSLCIVAVFAPLRQGGLREPPAKVDRADTYCLCFAIASAMLAFTASRLKDARPSAWADNRLRSWAACHLLLDKHEAPEAVLLHH
jgi:hypothetical protein